MTERRSVKGPALSAKRADKRARDAASVNPSTGAIDSFVNFQQRLGIGADNALSTAGYGFNPITRQRTTLEWIHRGSWLGGVAIDVMADDMTRGGVDIEGQITPENIKKIESEITALAIWARINETIKWSRLYGGCLAVLMIDGQNMATPLRMETIARGQFKGLLVLDRWMVEPTLNDLVTTMGPDLGLPKYYTIAADAPALPSAKVHHSRCVRLIGIDVPYYQRLQENLWGISVIERLYDRMVAFDSATTGAAQLVYKAYIRTYKVKGLREVVAAGGPALQGLMAYVEMMRRFQGQEGITLMDGEDEFESMQHSAFSGLSDALTQFGQQLSGALQIPLVRLFGQSPSGFSSGDTDIRMYYDNILKTQNQTLRTGINTIYRAIAQSVGVVLDESFGIAFRSLWQLTEAEKADIAGKITETVVKAVDAGLVSDQVAMKELKQAAARTGIFSNITDKDIADADDVPAPPEPEGEELGAPGAKPPAEQQA